MSLYYRGVGFFVTYVLDSMFIRLEENDVRVVVDMIGGGFRTP